MERQEYRPLIRLHHSQELLFLSFNYVYSLREIAAIKKHLPKIFSFWGVDAQTFSPSDRPLFEHEKLKLKAVQGKNTVDEQPLKFYSKGYLEMVVWRNIYLWVDLPFSSKHDSQTAKEDLENKMEKYLKTHLHFRHINNHSPCLNTDRVKPNQVDIYFQPSEVDPTLYDKEYREVRVKLPLVLVLPKQDNYLVSQLREALEPDIINCLKIMTKNEMTQRVIRTATSLFLQSFVKADQEEELEGNILMDLMQKKKLGVPEEVEKEEEKERVESRGADPSNKVLLMVLIALAAIYLYLKINPLKKTLEQM